MDWFIDANTLIYLAKSGTSSDPTFALQSYLDAMRASGINPVITDVNYYEAALKNHHMLMQRLLLSGLTQTASRNTTQGLILVLVTREKNLLLKQLEV